MMWRSALRAGALVAVVVALAALAGIARVQAEDPAVVVRGGEHKGFGRLVFDFAAAPSYSAEIAEGALLVSFPAAARFDLSPLSRDLEDYIGTSRVVDDGKAVRIPLKAGFTMKHYMLGPKLVIDLIDPPDGLAKTADDKAPETPKTRAAERPTVAQQSTPPVTEPASDTAKSAPVAAAGTAAAWADTSPDIPPGAAPGMTLDAFQHGSGQDTPGQDSSGQDGNRAAEAAPAQAPVEAPADPAPPSADQGPKVLVRVGEHGNFSRMVFDWPFNVPYRIEEAQGKATIWFDRPARLDLSRYRQDPPERVNALVPRTLAEGLAVDLALPKGVRLTHYTDGPLVVVDVVGGTPATAKAPAAEPAGKDKAAAEPAQEAQKAEKPEETPAKAQAAAPQPTQTQPTPAQPAPTQQAQEQPASGPAAAPTELLPEGMKEQAADAAADKPKTAAQEAQSPAKQAAAPDKPAADTPDASAKAASDRATPAAEPVAAPEVALISANAAATDGEHQAGEPAKPRRSIALRFNWAEPVGAAAFLYSGRLWLVFDRPVKSNIAERISKAAPALNPVEQLEHPSATVLRLRLPVGFTARLRIDGDDWIADLRKHETEVTYALNPVVDYSDAEACLRVAMQEPGHVMTVTDPDLGATLWVVPTRTPGLAMERQFSLPEVRLLPTFQGLAVEPRADNVAVALDEQGALISGESGFNVSADTVRDAQSADVAAFDTGRRLLDLEAWRGATPFLARKQELQQSTVQAEPGNTDLARLEVARFYFAHGLASEALGALELMERDPNRLDPDPQVLLIKGASAFLNNEIEAAAESLMHPALDSEWDAHLWRGALAAAGGDWPSAAQILRESEPLIPDYSSTVRNKLWLLAAEAQIQTANAAATQEYLELVRNNEPTVFDEARADYLEGKRLALQGDSELAAELWQRVAQSGYGAAAARARMALIEQNLEQGVLTRAEAIAELEHLQFAWRGDAFEFSLLQRLGEFYIEQNRFRDALLTLRQAASYLPHAARSKAIAQRMREIFADLFLTDLGKAVPPVAALAIYREFRELTPGGEEGDRLVARLADRLVEVDLLDQAAELLQGQIDRRLAGQERAATGNRVAMLHLLDRRPKEALAVLTQTDMEDLPDDLAHERRLLRARALIESDRSAEGLALLGDDKSDDAHRLRAQVYWTERRWPEAAAALEGLLPEEPPAGAGDAEDSARLIASLAVAYTLAGDRNGLADLDWRFGNFMARSAQADAFAMLTGDLNGSSIVSIADELAGVETIQAFMLDYRERLGAPAENAVN